MARALCQALIDMHEEGVVHRDVKPDNVLLTSVAAGSPGGRSSHTSTSQLNLSRFSSQNTRKPGGGTSPPKLITSICEVDECKPLPRFDPHTRRLLSSS